MRTGLLGVTALLAAVISAHADDGRFVIKTGRIVRLSTDYQSLPISVENQTATSFKAMRVSCGFYAGDRLVATDSTILQNVGPGETAHATVLVLKAPEMATSAKCRVDSAH